jgi:hypothetical protein
LPFDTHSLAESIEEPVYIGMKFFAPCGSRDFVERDRSSEHPRQRAIRTQQALRIDLAVSGFIGGARQDLAQSAVDS